MNQMRKNVIWNMIGSILYALATIVLMSVAGRTTGVEGGALFTAAYTLAQQLLTIGFFEMRAFQVTDLQEQYTFEDYFTFRLITCGVMLLSGIGYALFSGGGAAAVLVVILVCAYKMLDALADVFEGEFQKRERLDLSGKSLAVRMVASMVAFTVVGWLSHSIVAASFGALMAASAVVVLTDIRWVGSFAACRARWNREHLKGIFHDCVLLFVGSFFNLYLMNGAKYAGEIYLSPGDYYAFTAAIFMPANVICLVCSFLLRPVLVSMMKHYQAREYQAFERLVGLLLGGVGIVTAAALAGGAWLGLPVLELIYPLDLTGRLPELLIVILGGSGYALSVILYYVLTVMRRQKEMCFAYIGATVVTAPVPYLLSSQFAMTGTAVSYCVLMYVQTAALGGAAIYEYRKDKKKHDC